MKSDQTALALAQPPPDVEQVRRELARARAQVIFSAEALKAQFSLPGRVVAVVRKHPWLALGAAFAVGVLLAGPGRKK